MYIYMQVSKTRQPAAAQRTGSGRSHRRRNFRPPGPGRSRRLRSTCVCVWVRVWVCVCVCVSERAQDSVCQLLQYHYNTFCVIIAILYFRVKIQFLYHMQMQMYTFSHTHARVHTSAFVSEVCGSCAWSWLHSPSSLAQSTHPPRTPAAAPHAHQRVSADMRALPHDASTSRTTPESPRPGTRQGARAPPAARTRPSAKVKMQCQCLLPSRHSPV